jgi:hypothetical protein
LKRHTFQRGGGARGISRGTSLRLSFVGVMAFLTNCPR